MHKLTTRAEPSAVTDAAEEMATTARVRRDRILAGLSEGIGNRGVGGI